MLSSTYVCVLVLMNGRVSKLLPCIVLLMKMFYHVAVCYTFGVNQNFSAKWAAVQHISHIIDNVT